MVREGLAGRRGHARRTRIGLLSRRPHPWVRDLPLEAGSVALPSAERRTSAKRSGPRRLRSAGRRATRAGRWHRRPAPAGLRAPPARRVCGTGGRDRPNQDPVRAPRSEPPRSLWSLGPTRVGGARATWRTRAADKPGGPTGLRWRWVTRPRVRDSLRHPTAEVARITRAALSIRDEVAYRRSASLCPPNAYWRRRWTGRA